MGLFVWNHSSVADTCSIAVTSTRILSLSLDHLTHSHTHTHTHTHTGTPSPDVTPVASRDHVVLDDSIPPSPASTVSSTLQQFVSRLKGTHSSTTLETSCNGKLIFWLYML